MASGTISNQVNGELRNQGYSSLHVCKVCNKSFRNKSSLSEHRWMHSEETLPWRCAHCDKLFPFQSRLKKHQITHIEKCERTINYKCSVCDKIFFRKNDLWSHEKAKGHRKQSQDINSIPNNGLNVLSVHKIGYECPECEKILANSGSLFNHRRSLHHGDDSQKRFSCPECCDRFALKQKMNSHIRRCHLKDS